MLVTATRDNLRPGIEGRNELRDGIGVNESEFVGYTVTYGRGETQFPVYVMGFLATLLIAGGFASGYTAVFAMGVAAAAIAYFHFPLLDTQRPRIGANQYGIFIDAFGLIKWRAVKSIELVPIAVRASTVNELQIALDQPLNSALVADWRKLPFYRRWMRVLWSMTRDNTVVVTLDPLERDPDEIHRTLTRMWRYYRS